MKKGGEKCGKVERAYENYYVRVPLSPPSFNQLYGISGRFNHPRVYLKQEAAKFKMDLKLLMPPRKFEEDTVFDMEIKVAGNWFNKNGTLKRKDVQNLDKVICDAVAERFGFDDKKIIRRTVEKVIASNPGLSILLIPSRMDERVKQMGVKW